MKTIKIIFLFLIIFIASSCKSKIESGIYITSNSDRTIFIDKQKNKKPIIYLDSISEQTRKDIHILFFSYDDIGLEKAVNKYTDLITKQNVKYIEQSVCQKMDSSENKYYIILYSDYKNRWYEREN